MKALGIIPGSFSYEEGLFVKKGKILSVIVAFVLVLLVYALCKLMKEQKNYERVVRECLHERELEERKEV